MKNKIIRVAFLANGIVAGGAVISLLLMLKSLQNHNIEVFLYSTKGGNEEIEKDVQTFCKYFKIIKIVEISPFELNLKKISLLEYYFCSLKAKHNIKQFAKELNSKHIDILHLNSTVFSLVPKIIKRKCNIKIITHLREIIKLDNNLKNTIESNRKLNGVKNFSQGIGYEYIQKIVINNIKSNSDYLISISENEIIPFKEHQGICVLPNPYDFKEDILNKFSRNRDALHKTVNICMTGKFSLIKNHLLLLKTINSLKVNKQLKPSYKFYFIGLQIHSPYTLAIWKRVLKKIRNYFQKRIDYNKIIYDYVHENQLDDVISFIPNTYLIKDLINEMDIIIRPDGFPWGRDIIEAMALKKAIIACGHSDFYIKNEKTGVLIPPASPEILAEKILELAENSTQRQLLGENAYIKIKSMCDLNEYGNKLLAIYKKIL